MGRGMAAVRHTRDPATESRQRARRSYACVPATQAPERGPRSHRHFSHSPFLAFAIFRIRHFFAFCASCAQPSRTCMLRIRLAGTADGHARATAASPVAASAVSVAVASNSCMCMVRAALHMGMRARHSMLLAVWTDPWHAATAGTARLAVLTSSSSIADPPSNPGRRRGRAQPGQCEEQRRQLARPKALKPGRCRGQGEAGDGAVDVSGCRRRDAKRAAGLAASPWRSPVHRSSCRMNAPPGRASSEARPAAESEASSGVSLAPNRECNGMPVSAALASHSCATHTTVLLYTRRRPGVAARDPALLLRIVRTAAQCAASSAPGVVRRDGRGRGRGARGPRGLHHGPVH
jgi:hypothetical protein